MCQQMQKVVIMSSDYYGMKSLMVFPYECVCVCGGGGGGGGVGGVGRGVAFTIQNVQQTVLSTLGHSIYKWFWF